MDIHRLMAIFFGCINTVFILCVAFYWHTQGNRAAACGWLLAAFFCVLFYVRPWIDQLEKKIWSQP